MTPTAVRLAVIVVNYHGYARKHLGNCYQGLLRQSLPKDRWDLIVSDSGSTAESRDQILRIAPEARILSQPEHRGWAASLNTAIQTLLKEPYGLFLILNMDTHFDKDGLLHLVATAERSPDIHLFQSKVLLSETGRINSLGNRIHFLGYGYCNGYGKEAATPAEPMDFASGSCLMVRRSVFEKIGLFREEYEIYYEDLEFCWRARLAGYRVGLAADSICYHRYDFQKMRRFLFLLERNRLLTLLSLEKIPTLLIIAPMLIPFQIGSLLYFSAAGQAGEMLRLIGCFLRPDCWRNILRWRRRVRSLRRCADREIVRNFSGKIQFAEIRSPFFQTAINPLLRLYWALARRLIFW